MTINSAASYPLARIIAAMVMVMGHVDPRANDGISTAIAYLLIFMCFNSNKKDYLYNEV